jgi:hypothetical protein
MIIKTFFPIIEGASSVKFGKQQTPPAGLLNADAGGCRHSVC